MGISGLLPCLRSVSRDTHIREYAGQRVAVDSYVWLHRGAFTCARELARGVPTDKYVAYFMRCVELLQQAGVEPLCVFDGGKLPSKAGEEAERERRRAENAEKADAHERTGHHSAAQECYQRAVDVSPAMAARVIQELRRRGVAFIVAPFEADAQMAFLAARGDVAAVVTEDSDLVAYGVPRVFLKMDAKTGAGVEVAATALPRCRELNLSGFTPDQFLQMCVLSGCDYVQSLPGVGPRRAAALLRRFRTASAAVRHLRFEGVPVPRGYEAQVQDALWTFAHQWVYDPTLRACVHRTPRADGPGSLPADRVEALLGPQPPCYTAAAIAEGRLCPITRQPFPDDIFAPAADAPAARAVRPLPPLHRNVIGKYFAPVAAREQCAAVTGLFVRHAFADAGAAALLAVEAAVSAGAEEAQAEASASASDGAVASEDAEEAAPVVPSTVKRSRARAVATAAAAATAAFNNALYGIIGTGSTPARAGALSVYSDQVPQSASSAGAEPGSAMEPSPVRPHPLSWLADRPPLQRPLHARSGNLAGRLAAAEKPPPQHTPVAPATAKTSKFFPAAVPQSHAMLRPERIAPAAAADGDQDASDGMTASDAAALDHASRAAPSLGVDVRHCASLAAAATAALDRRFEAFRRDSAGGATADGGAASTKLRSPVVPLPAAKRARVLSPSPLARAGASAFDAFLFAPRAT